MYNFKLLISYDGGAYHGWQRQKSDRTIQGELEQALKAMTAEKVSLLGSGRTDAGVHALGQVASFRTQAELSPDIYIRGLNSLLPEDILIQDCTAVPPGFHARYDVCSKVYQYRILNQDMPAVFERQYVWHIKQKLDVSAMQQAAGYFVGCHDFKAFEGTGSPRTSTIRNIFRAQLSVAEGNRLFFDIEADGFLRYMVRNIVGTLVAVGRGRLPARAVPEILNARDRGRAGATAPAKGLFLVEVKYENPS